MKTKKRSEAVIDWVCDVGFWIAVFVGAVVCPILFHITIAG